MSLQPDDEPTIVPVPARDGVAPGPTSGVASGPTTSGLGAGNTLPLGTQLGPVLIQTPPYLKKDTGLLREFLAAAVPPGRAVAFELQAPSWESDDVDQVLADHGCARCIADKDDGSARLVRTAPWSYVRLRKDDYTDGELAGWLARVRGLGGERA